MSGSRFLVNLALSLFVAPIPALMALGQMAGPQGIPLWVGIVAMAGSAGVYWMAMFSLRGKRGKEKSRREAAPESTALVLRQEDRYAGGAGESYAADPRDRHRAHDVRSYEDLPDPLAESRGLKPAEVLIDRVSDITQVKRLVEANKVHLVTAWYRHVRDSATGDRVYGDWALEADRLLLSASFMTRTLTRHEAIALVTAEVAARVEARRAGESAERARSEPVEAAPALGAPDMAAWAQERGWQGDGATARPRAAAVLSAQQSAPAQEAEVIDAGALATSDGYRLDGRLGPLLDGMTDAIGTSAGRGVVPLLPQVVLRRCRALLECSGWRTSTDAEAVEEGIDLFAERQGRIVGLRLVAGDIVASPELVLSAAHAGAMFGTDLVAVVVPSGVDRATRGAATHAGVALLQDGDLSDLAAFLPGGALGPDGSGQTAAAE